MTIHPQECNHVWQYNLANTELNQAQVIRYDLRGDGVHWILLKTCSICNAIEVAPDFRDIPRIDNKAAKIANLGRRIVFAQQ